MSGDQWRPVVGYEGLYEVSNSGAVRTLERLVRISVSRRRGGRRRVRGRLLNPNGARYLSVTLTKNGKTEKWAIHRLVLEAFVGPRPRGMQCRHFPSRDTKDNRLSNLRWGTPRENQADRIAHGTSNNGRLNPHRTKADIVSAVRREYGSVGAHYARGRVGQRDLAAKYGISLSTVNVILHKE